MYGEVKPELQAPLHRRPHWRIFRTTATAAVIYRMSSTTPAEREADLPGQGLHCPACGYDLRGSMADRCSECGLVLDREDLARSNFPWVYREKRGRLNAFLSTIWGVTLDRKVLRHEAAKPQAQDDALKFRRWVTVGVVIAFASVAALFLATEGVDRLVVEDGPTGLNNVTMADLVVPWVAGFITVPLLIVVYAALAGFTMVRAPLRVLRPHRATSSPPDTVRAIGCYVTGPLFFLFTAALGVFMMVLGERLFRHPGEKTVQTVVMTIGGMLSLTMCIGIPAAIYHTGQWRARLTRRGHGTGLLAMGELLLWWLLAGASWFGVVPWCVGFVWIVIDSFRF